MSEWRESQGHEWCAKKQAKEVKPQSSGVCSGRSPLGGERRLGEPAGDGAGQVGRKAVFCLFICFLPSFLFTLLSYCGVVTCNKKCIFAWVLITTAPKTLEFSKSWKPWRCLLLRKGVTFVPHIRVRECLPVEPIMWLEGWNLRSQSLTSGEERGAGGWVQSPMARDWINRTYVMKLPQGASGVVTLEDLGRMVTSERMRSSRPFPIPSHTWPYASLPSGYSWVTSFYKKLAIWLSNMFSWVLWATLTN